MPPAAQHAGLVRAHLKTLPDVAGATSGRQRTLQSVAVSHGVSVSKLRSFRDGTNTALDKSLITTWAKLLGADSDIDTGDPLDRQWLATLLQQDTSRVGRYRTYDVIDETRPEAARALDCWADIVTTGSVGEDRYSGGFEPNYGGELARERKLLNVIAEEINTHLLPPAELHMLVRDMAKFGDQFEQIGLEKREGQMSIGTLVNMPVKTMHYNRQENGSIDPAKAFKQVMPGKTEPSALFPAWKIVHFCNKFSRGDTYGRSIFYSNLRSHIQIEAMEAGMMIRRLERAPFRLKHVLDLAHCNSQQEQEQAIDKAILRHKKVKTIDGNRNFHQQKISMPADQDLFVPKRTVDSPADIVGIQGDANLDQTGDFDHFWSKWCSGLGPPKAHLGYEMDTMRSTGVELHAVFARMGRRLQMKVIRGLVHLYWVSLILRGFDPRSVPFTIYPPAVGTRDELLRAQVQVAHATTVRYLAQAFAQTGKVPSIPWFLQYVMGLDDEVIDKLQLEDVMLTTKGALDAPTNGGNTPQNNSSGGPSDQHAMELASAAMASGDIREEIARTRFLFNEQAIGLRKPELMSGGTPEQYEWMRRIDPFGDQFEAIVSSLGRRVSELKSSVKS